MSAEEHATVIREALAKHRRNEQLLDGRDFDVAQHDANEAAFHALLAEVDEGREARKILRGLAHVGLYEPPDHVFRFFQRLHGLPETGGPSGPTWKRRAEEAGAELTAFYDVLESSRVGLLELLGSYQALIGRPDVSFDAAMEWDGPVCARRALDKIAALSAASDGEEKTA